MNKRVDGVVEPTSVCTMTEVPEALTSLLADVFALYIKTKNFHWHVHGPHFRDYHLLLDDQASAVFAMIDDVAERARKLGGMTIRSVGQIARLQRIKDNDAPVVSAIAMLNELIGDNRHLISVMRNLYKLCDRKEDVATASMLENWIDQTDGRIWFLSEITNNEQ